MLEKFGVMVLAEYLLEKEIEIAIRAFSDFYHEQTPKHQKRILLYWVDGYKGNSQTMDSLFKMYEIPTKILKRTSSDDKSNAMRDSSLLLHPSGKHSKAVIPDAFSFGLPVISMNTAKVQDYIDVSCGMLLHSSTHEQLIIEVTGRLDMLYHDQEVLKLLEKGSYDQYERKFGWGLKEFRRSLF